MDEIKLSAPPCRIGDLVWCVRRFRDGVYKAVDGRVTHMEYVNRDMDLSITVHNRGRGRWDETIFATKEAADVEAERRMGKHG